MCEKFLDHPGEVRKGEELPLEKLQEVFKKEFPGRSPELKVSQFPKGHSNLTYLVQFGDKELVLRRPPFGSQVKTAHDMGREFRILQKLCQVYPLAPKPYFYCEDLSILGAPFYCMERRRGLILRRDLPPGLSFSEEEARALSEAFLDALVALHSLDTAQAGLSDFGKPKGYCRRQVEGWVKRYYGSKTDEIPSIEEVGEYLLKGIPGESGASCIHNDYKIDNLVLDLQRGPVITGILDWEMATVGDPLMDFGSALGYWVNPEDPPEYEVFRMVPTRLTGTMTRAELAERYLEKMGLSPKNMVYYYIFGLFKLAVIAQQIYFRYAKGFTQDERFAQFIDYVRVLGRVGLERIQDSKL